MLPARERDTGHLRALATLVALATWSSAAAQPEPATQPQPAASPEIPPDIPDDVEVPLEADAVQPPAEVDATALAGAPRPGNESGRADPGERDSTMRRIGQGVLAIPRGLFELAFTPVREGVWVFDRYHLAERARRLFFNDAGTIGLYPTARFTSGVGLSVGARFVAELDDHHHTRLDAGFGGRYQQLAAGRLEGSYLDDRLNVELRLEYELRPRERFYGIGNGDEVPAMSVASSLPAAQPASLIDARIDDTAVATRYRQELARGVLAVDLRAVDDLHVRAAATQRYLELAPSEAGPPITEVYLPASLVGFDGVRHRYGELELAWDSRRPGRIWDSKALHSTGWLVSAFAGRAGVERHADYWRYGGDLQHFIRLDTGPRVIALRLHGEAVSGTRDEVPLVDLPALGGSSLLRGYPIERFRDRVAAVGSVEYEWDLARTLFGSVFVDAGRVFPAVDQLTLDDLRCGYGFALEVHGGSSFWMRASIASSIDGGVYLDLSFDPVFYVTPRVVRR